MVNFDKVTRSLLAAIGVLEELVEAGNDSHLALNGLESISYELSEMTAEEYQGLVDSFRRIADEEPDRAAWIFEVLNRLRIEPSE